MKKAITGIGIIVSLVIVLLILFLLTYLIFEKTVIFDKNINSCEAKGGKCVEECDYNVVYYECEGENLKCCLSPTND